MFQHILLPLDGSATATAAVEKAIALARAFGSKVTPISIVDPEPFYGQEKFLETAQADANAAIAAAQALFDAAGVVIQPKVVEAHVIWRGILDAAHEVGADLIVMGSHGRRGLEKLVLGSVAQSVLTHADISTLVVRMAGGGKKD